MYNRSLHFHFTGIGGSGMSGIAEVLHGLGFQVSGSDIKDSGIITRLMNRGIAIKIGHEGCNLPKNASLLVYSSAVGMDNPEVIEARTRGLPVVRRAEVLAELMRLKQGIGVAGSHGKTTTTSMIGSILEHAGFDPTVIIGGQVKALNGSGARLGKGEFLVAETDESDRSFLLLKPAIAVVTNIDAEHLEAYGTILEVERAFEQFVHTVPFYGLGVFCIDDPRTRKFFLGYDRRKVSYGLSPDANVRAENLEYDINSVRYNVFRNDELLFNLRLPIIGRHMATNSLAAIAVALELGIAPELIAEALAKFEGVQRRLEVIGSGNGITVLSDYGHHPTEIRATIGAIRSAWEGKMKRFHCIFQPHRYTRTRDSFVDFIDAFGQCDNLLVSEVYAANEEPIEGISGQRLCEAIAHPSKHYVHNLNEMVEGYVRDLTEGDLVLCLGAGSIGALPERILAAMNKHMAG